MASVDRLQHLLVSHHINLEVMRRLADVMFRIATPLFLSLLMAMA